MNAFITVSRIFFISLIVGCCGLCIKECVLNIKIMCVSMNDTRDTEITCSSENDISNDIV